MESNVVDGAISRARGIAELEQPVDRLTSQRVLRFYTAYRIGANYPWRYELRSSAPPSLPAVAAKHTFEIACALRVPTLR